MTAMCPSREFLQGRILSRREFACSVAGLRPAIKALQDPQPGPAEAGAAVALVLGGDRLSAVRKVLEMLEEPSFRSEEVLVKASYGSAYPYPATTHPDTLRSVVRALRESGCDRLRLVERSGMGATRRVWERLQVTALAARLGLDLLALDELPAEEWTVQDLPGSHWKRGVEVPRLLAGEALSVQVCNLKAHRFGGYFSAGIKNALGVVSKDSHIGEDHNFMAELHNSPDQRLMIAEASAVFRPKFTVMDAIQVFISEGPERGEVAEPRVVAASRDRVALDAAGLAILRLYSARIPGSRRNIFELEQIHRAGELGIGVKDPDLVRFVTQDPGSRALASQLKALMANVQEKKDPRE
ncbi:MAG: DUF362 domain-containing protein [Acidobacteria bacterium]|nr:DUF362 domain-containing protein [Acidobacteriota bacterium]